MWALWQLTRLGFGFNHRRCSRLALDRSPWNSTGKTSRHFRLCLWQSPTWGGRHDASGSARALAVVPQAVLAARNRALKRRRHSLVLNRSCAKAARRAVPQIEFASIPAGCLGKPEWRGSSPGSIRGADFFTAADDLAVGM